MSTFAWDQRLLPMRVVFKKPVVILFAGLLGLAHHSFASDSVFSKDNRRVYLRPYNDACGVEEVDLDKKEARFINLGNSIHESVENLALSNSGFILCATKTSIWAFDPAKSKCAKVCDFSGGNIACIAYDPTIETILVTTNDGQFALPKNADGLQPIFNRRAQGIDYPVYATDGTLFFEIRGDLWMGSIQREQDASLHRYGTLAGTRVAPLAALETSECNASSTGIHDIAVTKSFVYACYSRLGGSGWGNWIRIVRPSSDAKNGSSDSVPKSEDYWTQAKALLGSVEILADCSSASYLCSSHNEQTVFYLNHDSVAQSKAYIIKNDGKAELIEIKNLAESLGWK